MDFNFNFILDAGKLVVTTLRPLAMPVIDAAIRTTHLIKGEMNFDITGEGKQLAGMGELLPGDVILKQGNWGDIVVAGIGIGQTVLNRSDHRYLGAGLLGHAMVYLGAARVAEAVDKGVVESYLDRHNDTNGADYSHYNFYVIRANSQALRDEICKTAQATIGKADYNHKGLIPAAAGIDVGNITGDPTAITTDKINKGERPKMFCSEFVVYCLNVAADKVLGAGKRFFSRSQAIISPEELYVGLRDNGDWTYVGELHKGVR